MGIFSQFPYTNFHEMNLDWILGKIKELWKGVADLDKRMDDFIADTEPIIRDEVDEWLNDHPEATTTVLDHSLTEIKFTEELAYKTIKDYVTPQMFGAIGDGINDDTQAVKDAVDSGKPVFIPEGYYNITETILTSDNVVFKNLGTFTNYKIVISKDIIKDGIAVAGLDSWYLDATGLHGIQGMCWNPDHDTMLMTSHVSSWGDPALIEIDWDTKTVIRSITGSRLEHANDITYNPNTKEIYVACLSGNKIAVVDAELFSFKQDINLDNLQDIGQISYDIDNNIYYIADYSTGIYVYDANFVRIKTLYNGDIRLNEVVNHVNYPHIQATEPQGSCVYNGQFLSLYWIWADAGYSSYARIIQYDYKTGLPLKYYDIKMLSSDDEPEALCLYDNKVLCCGYWEEAATMNILDFEGIPSPEKNDIKFFSQATNGAEIGITSFEIQGNADRAFCRFRLKALTALTTGITYYATISNTSNMQGMLVGFHADSIIITEIVGNSVNVRPFKNILIDSEFIVEGFITCAKLTA